MKKTEIALLAGVCLMAASALADIGTASIPATVTEVLPAKSGRKWFILQNNSTNDIYVKMDGSTNVLTMANGIKLPSGASLSVTATAANPAGNQVKAISATGTNSITYQEGNEK